MSVLATFTWPGLLLALVAVLVLAACLAGFLGDGGTARDRQVEQRMVGRADPDFKYPSDEGDLL